MNGIKNFKNMYSILTICLILVGAVLLIAPGIALDVVCIIFGIYMIIYGAVKIMGYFAKEENMEDDNPPIGIILSHNKDELLVEYATYGMDSNLFVSKYELYLPDRRELQKLLNHIMEQDIKEKEE